MEHINAVQKGITVGIPTLGRNVTLDWAFAYKSLVPPINFHMVTAVVMGKPVDLARNEIVAHALERNHKYIYFMGDDTIPPHNILKQLIYRAENNKDHGIITGVYCSKSDPPAPLVFRGNGVGSYWDWKIGEYFQITGCGMDAVLIRTDVFRELIEKNIVGKDRQGFPEFFKTVEEDDFDDNINNANMWTEDLYFLKIVDKHSSFKVFCDGTMICDHVDVGTGKKYTLPPDSYPVTGINKERAKGMKKAIDIGCGMRHANLGDEFHVIRVDIQDECNPTYRCDARKLPFDNRTFDLVFSSHVLEHFSRAECMDVLAEWIRLLKPDGELRLVLPNINWAIEQFKAGVALQPDVKNHVWNVLYGGQANPYDFHYNGWTEQTLKSALEEFGFNDFEWQSQGYNMICQAWRKGYMEEDSIHEEDNNEVAELNKLREDLSFRSRGNYG